jgi:hypothetical protein
MMDQGKSAVQGEGKGIAKARLGTRARNISLLELTNTVHGCRQRIGRASVSGCTATPKPGPEVRGSPSAWYFALPIAFNRFAKINA